VIHGFERDHVVGLEAYADPFPDVVIVVAGH
jgi:hypothetical protein